MHLTTQVSGSNGDTSLLFLSHPVHCSGTFMSITNLAQKIVYGAFDRVAAKSDKPAIEVFEEATLINSSVLTCVL